MRFTARNPHTTFAPARPRKGRASGVVKPFKPSPRVLVGCEYSGRVRDAFARRGWDAWSCDTLPTEIPGQHYQGDVLEMLSENFDIGIFHPSCRYLTVAGARWKYEKPGWAEEQDKAIEFARARCSTRRSGTSLWRTR